ncbi:MAG: methyltransferase family protein [Opitutales bacterium]
MMRLAGQPAWWIKTGVTLVLAVWAVVHPVPVDLAVFCAVAVAIAGAAINLWHYRLLKVAGKAEAPTTLVTQGGLWPFVRHPMYLGEGLLMLALAVMARGPSIYLMFVGWIAIVRLALAEDRAMGERFPQAHVKWRQRAGLLFPKLRGRPAE